MVKRPDAFTGAHEQSHIQLATFTPKTAKVGKLRFVKKHARLLNGLRGLAVWLDGMDAEHNAKLVRRAMEIIGEQS